MHDPKKNTKFLCFLNSIDSKYKPRQISVYIALFIFGLVNIPAVLSAKSSKVNMSFAVMMPQPESHLFHVELTCTNILPSKVALHMPAWTPGFYEIIDYAGAIKNFKVTDAGGKSIPWTKISDKTWSVSKGKINQFIVSYDVLAENPFIAYANLQQDYAYLLPGAVFMYIESELKHPVKIAVKPHIEWPALVVTGLTKLQGTGNTFLAGNFDELYDSPLLAGRLEMLPTVSLQGKKISFAGFGLGSFDRKQFMTDLLKIVQSGSKIIGDVPFNHYSFLAVGMDGNVFGGIEHLNSSSLIISNGDLLGDKKQKEQFYSFLAHEFFHAYNVKRIRPVALGPFDYSKENYTNLLWVSEGFTDYYENLIMNRAGLMTAENVLSYYEEHIKNYENSTGHLFQSAAEASRGIWAQRGMPTERTPEETAKTISVYDKGCALGMLMDLEIRHTTNNKKSLDDVMRLLYNKYYLVKKRGFTDIEFRKACELIAGKSLAQLFTYANTVEPVDYPKYLAYAGLEIDTTMSVLPELSTGATARYRARDSSLLITDVIWQSPAFNAGIQKGDKIDSINSRKANGKVYAAVINSSKEGEMIKLAITRKDKKLNTSVALQKTYEKSFKMTRVAHPSALQRRIYSSWLK